MDSLHGNNQPLSLLQQSPISFFPPELLHEIFSPLANRGPLQLRHALFVCKHWHAVITSDKRLWSTITIDEEIMERFQNHYPWHEISRVRAYIRACLDRSAPLPIRVTISTPLYIILGQACSVFLEELFKTGKPRHIQRCRSLSWCTGCNYKNIHSVSALLPKSFERLEYLFLKDFTIEGAPPTPFPQCPRLKEVHLFNHFDGSSPNYFLKRDHTSVEKLTYTSDEEWSDYDIPYIRNFHRIRTLVLENVTPIYFYNVNSGVEDTSIANLHYLETLTLIGRVPLEVMQRLHAPILRRVDIATGDSAPQSHSLNTVPLALLQSVTEMGIFIYSETLPDPQHLRKVIYGAPSLTSLFGTFEISRLLAGEAWFRERSIVYHCL
jgi:hypothetical protein